MVESKSVGTFQSLQKQDGHRGLFVDRGVGSPRLVKSPSATTFADLKLDSEAKVCNSFYSVWGITSVQSMCVSISVLKFFFFFFLISLF